MYFRYVAKDLKSSLADEISYFSLTGPNGRMAAKTAVSCTLAALLAIWLELDNVWWAPISALVVSQKNVGATLQKGLLRGAGTITGAILAIPLVAAVSSAFDSRLFMVAAIFLVCAATLELGYGRKNSYAWLMAGITAIVICLACLPDPTLVVRTAFNRASEILLGIASAWFAHLLFLHEHATRALGADLARAAALLSGMSEELTRQFLAGEFSKDPVKEADSEFLAALDRARGNLALASLEGLMEKDGLRTAQGLIPALAEARSLMVAFFRQARNAGGVSYQRLHEEEIRAIARELAGLLAGLGSFPVREGPPPLSALDGLGRSLARAQERYEEIRRSGRNLSYPVSEVLLYHFYLRSFRDLFHLMDAALRPGQPLSGARSPKSAPAPADEKARFVLIGSLSMAVVPVLWLLFDLPGIYSISVSALIILQPDAVETERKAALRLLGCVVGGGAGLVLLGLAPAQLFFVFWPLLFVVVYVFSYFAQGGPGHAYLGLQSALVFMLTCLQGNGPAASLAPPVARMAAITVATLVVLALTALLAGETPEQKLARHMEAMARICRRGMDELGRMLAGGPGDLAGLIPAIDRERDGAAKTLSVLWTTGRLPAPEHEAAEVALTAFRALSLDLDAFESALKGFSEIAGEPGPGPVVEELARALDHFLEDPEYKPNGLAAAAEKADQAIRRNVEELRRKSREQGFAPLGRVMKLSSLYILAGGLGRSLARLEEAVKPGLLAWEPSGEQGQFLHD